MSHEHGAGHGHGHDHAEGGDRAFDKDFWESHYSDAGEHDQHDPNRGLVAVASELTPGRALDAGCGEGRDAIWLATQGWQVTAVDISGTAVAAGRQRAEELAPEVAGRIEWVEADLVDWAPPDGAFDLVSSQFVHVPEASRDRYLARLTSVLARGGTLLVADHTV